MFTIEYAKQRMRMRLGNARYSAMPCDPWAWGVGPTARSGAGGHVGGQDIVRVAVEVFAGPVVAHRGARIGVAGRDLDVAEVHARVEHGRDEVWRSMCGWGLVIRTPAVSARRRRRRVAAWRSIRAPLVLSRIGPLVRVSMARPTAGGSGIRTILVPLPHTRSTR